MDMPPLISLIGPTASGKTGLGIALAREFNGEIVSADSRQIYQEMSIATAKPTLKEREQAKHHLVDCIAPDQEFNLSEYKRLACEAIDNIYEQRKTPFLVGGTGLYVSAVTANYQLPEAKPDLALRKHYEALAVEKGKEAVHQELMKLDPLVAKSIHPNNLRYVIRALEIASASPIVIPDSIRDPSPKKNEPQYHNLFLYIDWPRETLYRRIEKRIDQQIKEGLLEEARRLIEKYNPELPSISSLGYRELGGYLNNEISYEKAVELFKQNTRNYAKRQLTWFRKIPKVYSIPGDKLHAYIRELDN